MSIRRLAAFAALLVLAACAGSSAGAPPPRQLIVARAKDSTGLDPAHETDSLSLNVSAEVMETLVGFRPGGFEIVPQLARAWRTTPDGKTWTFDLAHGHRFSDGTPVDAAAVKFNFDRWRLGANHGPFPYGYYASQFGGFDAQSLISDVDAVGSDRIVLHLRAPLGPLLRNLAITPFAIGEPAAIRRDPFGFGTRPIGSGPYRVQEWAKDDHLTLVANPYYAGPTPWYHSVIFDEIPDQSTSVLAIENGDVDVLTDPRPDDANLLARAPGVTLYRQPSNNVMYLALNLDKPPFGNLFVRRAIAAAIDKTAIVKNFYATGATVAQNWTPPGMLGGDPSLHAAPYDPTTGRALLARAGLPNGFRTELYYMTAPRPYLPEPQRVAEAIQANLRAIGIEATLEPFEFGVLLEKIRNGEHPMVLIGWSGDNGDPDNFMYPLLDRDSAVKGQAQNYSFWRDPAFHALMLAGQRTSDEAERRRIYERANAMIADQVPAVAITHSVITFAARSSVRGVVPRPDSILNFELMRGSP